MKQLHLTQPKRILVAGGSGFLGSHLCEQLISEGHEVICVDNFFTGSKENLNNIANNKRFELIRHDITIPLFIEIDEIYNIAIKAGAYGGKINGAGAGGFILFIVPEGKQGNVKESLKHLKQIDIKIESYGSRVVFSDQTKL